MALNIKNLTILRDWLQAGAPHEHIKFNMATYIQLRDARGNITYHTENACGAVCCMAGAAAQFFAPKELTQRIGVYSSIATFECHDIARKALGLTSNQARDLFEPDGIVLDRITAQEAGEVVNHLIKTGKVDWRVAGYDTKF